jgi:hypothetical protein
MLTQVNKEKGTRKSDEITRTPKRRKTSEITPQAKDKSKREQENIKKSKKDRKDDLRKYFGEGARVPAPTNTGSPIDTVLKRRETKEQGGGIQEKGGEVEEAARGQEEAEGKISQATGSAGEFRVNLEAMKTPLKVKGTGTSRPKKKKNTAEEVDEKNKGKKKATFAEAVQEKPAQKVDYKKCVVGFVIRVDKGNNTKKDFNKKLMEGLNFMRTYIDSHAAFFSYWEGPNGKTHQGKSGNAQISSHHEELFQHSQSKGI